MEAIPSKFITETSKILYTGTYLRQAPADRFRLQWKSKPTWQNSYSEFCTEIRRLYGNPDDARLAIHALKRIECGEKETLADYTVRFNNLMYRSQWKPEKPFFAIAFEDGLPAWIRGSFARNGVDSTDLVDLKNTALRLDNNNNK
jgi:hypothetical protein